MENYTVVLPEHLNHYDVLFGGQLLKWADEFAYIAATIEFPDHRFVTIALDHVEFKHQIPAGEILRFSIQRSKLGTTSVHYAVQVFGTRNPAQRHLPLFETTVIFVSVDQNGDKQPIRRDVRF